MPATPALRLTPELESDFRTALLNAFTRPRLVEVLFYRLGKRFDLISETGSFDTDAFVLLTRARMEGWTGDLFQAVREANPASPDLVDFAEKLDEALDSRLTAGSRELERRIREKLPLLDIAKWRTGLGEIEYRVCRVEYPEGEAQGTGFLVGPSLVMTNFHVMEDVIADTKLAKTVILRFDYKTAAKGVAVNEGTTHRLAAKWLEDKSEYSPGDLTANPFTKKPSDEHMDYALLRTSTRPGDEPVGGAKGSKGDPKAPRRGWIPVPATTHDFLASPAVCIAQHPDGEPLKLALDTDAVIDVNDKKKPTRVRYRTNTESGSSGSPCFNIEWDLIALHHSGDPNHKPTYKPKWNAGIPISAIARLLEKRGKLKLLGT